MPLAAIHGDFMPARHQPCGKLFGEGFKPAIAGGNPARAENRDARRCLLSIRVIRVYLWLNQPRAALERAKRPRRFRFAGRRAHRLDS